MLVPILLGCVCVLVVTLYLQYRWRHRRVLEAASKLPCPHTLPLIGNAHLLIGDRSMLYKRLMQWANQYKGLYCVWAGPIPLIIASNPDDVKIILNSSGTLEKADTYECMRSVLGEGLITGHVSVWRRHRRIISPVFNSSNLEQFLVNMNEVGENIVDELHQQNGKGSIDPKDIIIENILRGTVKNSLGDKMIELDNEVVSMSKYVTDWLTESAMIRMFNPAFYHDIVFKLFYWNKQNQASKCLSTLTSVIKEVMDKYKLTNAHEASKHWISIIDIWYESISEAPDDPYWVDEILTFQGAATETTVITTYFLLASLAANQEVQDKLYSEIKEVLGSRGGDLTMSDLNSMTYLGHVLTESMRLHGVVPFIGRLATRDTKLTRFTLPAGANVFIHLHAMGWNPHVFPEPHRFNPDRFLTASEKEYNTMMNSLMTFSAGPRHCIGKNYAIILMKCVMVHILSKYKLLTDLKLEDIEYELGFVTSPKHSLTFEFQKRH